MLHPPCIARSPASIHDRRASRRVITRHVADDVAEMMRAVVSYGTGTLASSSMTTVNGKTGTAELGPRHQDATPGSSATRRPRRRRWWCRCWSCTAAWVARPLRRSRGEMIDDAPAVSDVRGIVLDMEGVLHVDWSPIPGSAEAVAELASRRHRAGCAHEHHGQHAGGDRGAAGGDRLRAAGRADHDGRIGRRANTCRSAARGRARVRAGRAGCGRRAGRDRAGG